MGVRTKVIGRVPTDHGEHVPGQAYGAKYQVTKFGCVWESKHNNNTTAPATLNQQTGTITENTTDWKKVTGSYDQWLMDNGYKDVSARNVTDGNHTQHDINETFSTEIGADDVPASIKGRIKTIEQSKGTAGGIATLDSGGKVPVSQLPSMNYVPNSEKGANGGVATLDNSGKVPSSQLPSYVDDVIDLLDIAATAPEHCAEGDKYYNSTSKKIFTATGTDTWGGTGADPESGKIYITLDDNKEYRWSGTTMAEISESLALGETSSTAFAGNRGVAIEGKIPSAASPSNQLVDSSTMQAALSVKANKSDVNSKASAEDLQAVETRVNASIQQNNADVTEKLEEAENQIAGNNERMDEVEALVQQAQMAIGAVPSDTRPKKDSTNWPTSGGVYESMKNIRNPYYYKVPSSEITIVDNKTMVYGGSTFADAAGKSIAIVEAKFCYLRLSGVSGGFLLAGFYSGYPDMADATVNQVPGTGFTIIGNDGYWKCPLGTKYIVVTLFENKNTAELVLGYGDEYGGGVNAFVDKDISVPVLSNNQNILTKQEYIIGIDGSSIIYEVPITNEKWFILWGEDGVTDLHNGEHSYMEFDENDNILVDERFFSYPSQLSFGKNPILYKKFRLSDGCKKVRFVYKSSKEPDYFAARNDFVFVNEDGSVPRNNSIVSVDGKILNMFGDTFKGKTIVCLGDSITQFGSAGADGGWPWYLQKNFDCAIHNVAVGMNTVRDNADTDPTSYTLTSTLPNRTLSTQLRYIEHYGIVPDIAIITGGTNDEGGGSGTFDPGDTLQDAINEYQNGTITQEAVRTTMYCAIAHIVAKLRVINPDVKIFVGTTIYRLALSQKDRIATINQIWKDIADTFSCEVIDFNNELPLYPAIANLGDENTVNPYYNGYNSQTVDPTHPSQIGVNLMGRLALSVIRNLYKEQ